MDHDLPTVVLHWNYRGFTEFPLQKLEGGEAEVTDIYLKENLISKVPNGIGKLVHLESLYLSGNDITELPTEIARLQCLKCLDMSGNRLKRVPEEIGDLQRLKFLILDENELAELPLRLSELRALRYLSVCDNKLKWLPQRPVYNYYHCEFRFWRNPGLKTIPYSLWYHMFRGQQTRSLNIGCLTVPRHHHTTNNCCRIKLSHDSGDWEVDVDMPGPYTTMFGSHTNCPPSLYEICRRALYQLLTEAAKTKSTDLFSIYVDCTENCGYNNYRNNIGVLGGFNTLAPGYIGSFVDPVARVSEEDSDNFAHENTDNGNSNWDLNGNNLNKVNPKDFCTDRHKSKDYYVPKDIIENHFSFLPKFMKQDLCNGPVSRCENVSCKMPVFDYAYYEFCLGNLILIDTTQEILLSAAFCSRACANAWRKGKTNLLKWTLIEK
ncbi:leucine rich repeat domain-containing protein [Phthorimaea operculella]|nr:leucine rich repeat domain-containing protein [Phthorimaea operculella]